MLIEKSLHLSKRNQRCHPKKYLANSTAHIAPFSEALPLSKKVEKSSELEHNVEATGKSLDSVLMNVLK